MRAFRGMFVVAAMAAICLGSRAASAQFFRTAGGVMDASGAPVAAGQSAVPSVLAAGITGAPGQQPSPYCGVGGCDVGCGCDAGCRNGCGCDPVWRGFGDFLYLRARNEGVDYAQAISPSFASGPGPVAQFGATAVMNPEFAPGFRVGLTRALSECSEISVAYTYYRGENSSAAWEEGGNPLQELVLNPQTTSAYPANGYASAAAHEITKFQYADIDFRHNLWGCDCACLNYFVGFRYAALNQQFDASFVDVFDTTSAAMQTNVDFDGLGLRLGLDGERALPGGFFTSAKAVANFIGGEFRADYQQIGANATAARTEVLSNWREARFVTILEAEVAIGWQSPNGRFRASVGYLITDWLNAVKTSDYINSIQTNSNRGANEVANTALVFDGLTGHVELTW